MGGEGIGGGGPRGLPLSAAYRAGDLVFLSGQVGFGPGGTIVAGGIEAETRQTLQNLEEALALVGGTLADIAKVTVFLADLSEFDAFNRVYRSVFAANPPARSVVQAGLMVAARVEIEAVAYVGARQAG